MKTLVRTMLGNLRRRAERSEQGDTLIELLIAIVIIALTVTALLGALVTSLTSSSTQKSLSTVDAVLNSFAQSAQYEAQQAFVNCTPTPYRLVSAPMPAVGPVGASVVVFVTGFSANTGLQVTLTPAGGGGAVPASITSGSTTDANGNATVTFVVPGSVTGTQNVSVSDGTSTASPTPFVVGGTTEGTAPVGYSIAVNPVQQWDAQGSSWVAATTGTCPNSGAQQLTAFAQGPNGASGTLSFVVLHAATTTVLVAATPSPGDPASCSPTMVLGCSVTFTATVIPPNSTTPYPQGTIGWGIVGPNSPTCPNSALTNIAGTNTSQATCKVAYAWAGSFNVTATYLPGGNYGTGGKLGVANVAAASSSSTITTSSASPSPAQPGSTLSFTATVGANPANSNDPQASGNVTWTITAPSGTAPSCTGGDTQVMKNNGTGTNATTCSFTLPTNAPTGTYSASANYGGDTNYTTSVSPASTISVNKGTPTLKFTPPPSPQVGSPFTVTVTVQGNGSITPQGTVTWTITPPSGSAPICSPSNVSTLSNSGQATCQVTPTVAGTYTVAAAYGGNTAYNGASGQIPVAVTLAPAGFDIQTTGNPADNEPDGSDKVVYTYNQAMSLNSIMNGLTLNSPVNVSAVFTRSTGATSLTIQCTGFRCNNPNLGSVSLGDTGSSHYIAGSFFGNTVTLNATLTASTDAAGQTVITIALTGSSGSFSAVPGATTLTWTPSNQTTNPAGTACATTAINESGAPKANF